MMDGDLQDPPEILAEMYRMITVEDYDIVSGKKIGRKGKKGRYLGAYVFHEIFKRIGDIRNMDNYGNFSMMKRIAADALLSMKEKVRYLPGLRTFMGFRQGDVGFVRDKRFSGKPKMTIRKLFFLATDAIFSFSRFPIRSMPDIGSSRNTYFSGSRNLCSDSKSRRKCSARMVIHITEHLFPGVNSACLPGYHQ